VKVGITRLMTTRMIIFNIDIIDSRVITLKLVDLERSNSRVLKLSTIMMNNINALLMLSSTTRLQKPMIAK